MTIETLRTGWFSGIRRFFSGRKPLGTHVNSPPHTPSSFLMDAIRQAENGDVYVPFNSRTPQDATGGWQSRK